MQKLDKILVILVIASGVIVTITDLLIGDYHAATGFLLASIWSTAYLLEKQ